MALSDMGGINYQYKDVAETIVKLHIMFKAAGVKKGDGWQYAARTPPTGL